MISLTMVVAVSAERLALTAGRGDSSEGAVQIREQLKDGKRTDYNFAMERLLFHSVSVSALSRIRGATVHCVMTRITMGLVFAISEFLASWSLQQELASTREPGREERRLNFDAFVWLGYGRRQGSSTVFKHGRVTSEEMEVSSDYGVSENAWME